MPISEAQLTANRANALKSSGPKTQEGKERSRANGLKHGLTGAGVVAPEHDKAEVDARAEKFRLDLKPKTNAGLTPQSCGWRSARSGWIEPPPRTSPPPPTGSATPRSTSTRPAAIRPPSCSTTSTKTPATISASSNPAPKACNGSSTSGPTSAKT